MDRDALAAYLRRIGDDGPLDPDLATLRRLTRRHMLAVPFENLDAIGGKPVSARPGAAFAKIVERGRGGWCFEMNGLFGEVLSALGFAVEHVGAAVGKPEPLEVDHRALLVHLDQTWLVDVGFGFGPTEPLPLREGETQTATGTFRLLRSGDVWTLQAPGRGPDYAFRREARDQAFFDEASRLLIERGVSPIVSSPLIVRALDDGYLSLHNGTLLRWKAGELIEERLCANDEEMFALRSEHFGLPRDLGT